VSAVQPEAAVSSPAPRPFRGSVPAHRLALCGILLAIWWVGALVSPPYILPDPITVVRAFFDVAGSATFFQDVGATCGRVFVGFALALVVGVPVGILFGANRAIGTFFEPVLPVLNTVSSAIWAIFAILWFGANDLATVFVVFMTSMPLVITNTWQGTRGVSAELVEVALSLRFTNAAILRKIFLPSIMPHVFSGARLAFGFGWRVSLVAETLGSSSGIGYRLRQSADLFQIDQVFAWTFVMVGLMLLIEMGVLRPLERHLFRWQRTRQL